MATTSSLSQGSIISFSGTPTIIGEKLNWKNYRAWLDSVELWFLGQGFNDHLEKQKAEISEENRAPWLKLDYQLCAILWQSVSPELLEILRSFKTCYSFWTNARDVFANDVQRLFDSTQKIVSLQQTNHDMVSQITKVRVAAENHAMVASCRGRSGCGTRGMSQNGKGGCDKTANISSSDIPSNERTGSQLISDEEYQEFLKFKSNNHAQSSVSPSISTACISHSMGSQGPWIIDSGASDHISGNDSMFSSISPPKFPHLISLAN
ncbi:hypothetical protein CR513_49223, partial [Mucuna pruriens]